MRADKWQLYLNTLQAHPTVCGSSHTLTSMDILCRHICPQTYPRLLDIGCGSGNETELLCGLGYTATGLIHGRKNYDHALRAFPKPTFVLGDMHDLPFGKDAFDAALLWHVFEHAYAPLILLLELFCVLREGGRVGIAVPSFAEITDPAIVEAQRISHYHPAMLCENLFRQMFTVAGFRVLEVSSQSSGIYILERLGIDVLHSDVQAAISTRWHLFE
jgi:SAM-dependent methyltransferase